MFIRQRFSKSQIGPDIDLDKEAVHLADGTRLTEAAADRSVGGDARSASRTALRQRILCSDAKFDGAGTGRVAFPVGGHRWSTRGQRLADVSRAALEEYVERHAS